MGAIFHKGVKYAGSPVGGVATDSITGTTSSQSGILALPSNKKIISCTVDNSYTSTAYMSVLFNHQNGTQYAAVFDLTMAQKKGVNVKIQYTYLVE